jgi:hypothetical protein
MAIAGQDLIYQVVLPNGLKQLILQKPGMNKDSQENQGLVPMMYLVILD